MSTRAKTVAAIASALYACLEEGEVQAPAEKAPGAEQRPCFQAGSPWALSGRQAIMDRRYHVQFRLNR